MTSAWPWGDLAPFAYHAIVADPPTPTEVWGEETGHARTPEAHYATMSIAAIAALPVEMLAADDCALFLWSRGCLFETAYEIARAWGFQPKTMGVWIKTVRDGSKPALGTGYIHRNTFEPYLVATRGRPAWRRGGVPDSFAAPRRRHSQKPAEFWPRIRRQLPAARRCAELFGIDPAAGVEIWNPLPHRAPETAP